MPMYNSDWMGQFDYLSADSCEELVSLPSLMIWQFHDFSLVAYSLHSNYNELQEFLRSIKPSILKAVVNNEKK